jgi:hypothetical protein
MKYTAIIHFPDEDLELEEEYDTEEEAEEAAQYAISCCETGAETLHMSNPGDYEYDEDDFDDVEYEIVEIED